MARLVVVICSLPLSIRMHLVLIRVFIFPRLTSFECFLTGPKTILPLAAVTDEEHETGQLDAAAATVLRRSQSPDKSRDRTLRIGGSAHTR
jgi:hypothetical protein